MRANTAEDRSGTKKGSVQIAAGSDMDTTSPKGNGEPRIAVAKLKDSTSATRSERNEFRGFPKRLLAQG